MKIDPTRPPATRVGPGPSTAATGPVSANETGTSPVETSQSRLDTRPSSSRGTSVWSNVIQMICPTSKSAAVPKPMMSACQSEVISP